MAGTLTKWVCLVRRKIGLFITWTGTLLVAVNFWLPLEPSGQGYLQTDTFDKTHTHTSTGSILNGWLPLNSPLVDRVVNLLGSRQLPHVKKIQWHPSNPDTLVIPSPCARLACRLPKTREHRAQICSTAALVLGDKQMYFSLVVWGIEPLNSGVNGKCRVRVLGLNRFGIPLQEAKSGMGLLGVSERMPGL